MGVQTTSFFFVSPSIWIILPSRYGVPDRCVRSDYRLIRGKCLSECAKDSRVGYVVVVAAKHSAFRDVRNPDFYVMLQLELPLRSVNEHHVEQIDTPHTLM